MQIDSLIVPNLFHCWGLYVISYLISRFLFWVAHPQTVKLFHHIGAPFGGLAFVMGVNDDDDDDAW